LTGLNVCAFFTQDFDKTDRYSLKLLLRAATALFFSVVAAPLLLLAQTHEATKPNPAIPEAKVKSRANDLLKQMTLDEKIAQLVQLPRVPVPEFGANADGQTGEQIIEKRGDGSMLLV